MPLIDWCNACRANPTSELSSCRFVRLLVCSPTRDGLTALVFLPDVDDYTGRTPARGQVRGARASAVQMRSMPPFE